MKTAGGLKLPNVALPKGDISDRGMRYLLTAITAAVLLLFAMGTLIFFGTAFPLGRLLVALFAAVLPVPLYASLILWLDRHEKEPPALLLAAFFWGAVVATLISLVLNSGAGMIIRAILGPEWASAIGASVVAPIVEETAKGVALVLLFLLARNEFNNVVDGIVYGGLIGLGFAMTENVLYFGRAHAQGGLAGVGVLFFMRVILGGLNHSLYTGMTGAGLGYSREAQGTIMKLAAPIAGFVGAILLHALWNGSATLLGFAGLRNVSPVVQLFVIIPGMALVLALPGLVTLVLLAMGGWKREVRVIQDHLKDEVEGGTVSVAELKILGSARTRLSLLRGALSKAGPQGWMMLRRLHELQVDLAFKKWHEARGEKLPGFQQVLTLDGYRERISQVRGRLAAMGVQTESR
jgi:RsiW-degrading membrane proteinase PrsW (M82 family)